MKQDTVNVQDVILVSTDTSAVLVTDVPENDEDNENGDNDGIQQLETPVKEFRRPFVVPVLGTLPATVPKI